MTPLPDALAALRRAVGTSLVRNSAALIANTGLNAVLGLAYWMAAARLYPPADVGGGAAAISGLILVASIGWTGLQYTLLRYLAVAGRRTIRLVLAAYGVAALVALPAALVFLLYAARSSDLEGLAATPLLALAFLGAVVIWVVFSLQDMVLIGLRRAPWVPVENAVYGGMKLAFLVVLASTGSAWGLLGSWVGGAVLLVVVMNALIFGRLLPRRLGLPDTLPPVARLARFTGGHHLAALTGSLPDSLLPIVVVALVSEQATAYYYAAWTVSNSMRLIAANIANALTVEGAHESERAGEHIRDGGRLGLIVVVPVAIGGILLADLVMGLFGAGYSEGASVLRIFSIGLVPFTLVTMFVAAERVRQRVGAAGIVLGASTTLTIVLAILLLPRLGIDGAAIGWLVAQLVAAGLAVAIERRRAAVSPAHERSAARGAEISPAVAERAAAGGEAAPPIVETGPAALGRARMPKRPTATSATPLQRPGTTRGTVRTR